MESPEAGITTGTSAVNCSVDIGKLYISFQSGKAQQWKRPTDLEETYMSRLQGGYRSGKDEVTIHFKM